MKFLLSSICLPVLWLASATSAPATPARFQEAVSVDGAVAPAVSWWTIFGDPQLDRLVERGLASNGDLATAAARLSLARAALRGAEAERMPRLGGGASVAGQSGTLVNAAGGTGSLFQLGGSASYELDLLGRMSKSVRAARLDAAAAALLLDSARLIAAADIAQTYFTLRALEADAAILASNAAKLREAAAIADRRSQSGLGSALDPERLRGELSSLETDRLAIERDKATATHALALLVGDERPVALSAWTPPPLPEIPAGLPSEMLLRRPDVAASVDSVQAAQLRLGATRASWFPAIGLTASGGQASTGLASLLSGAAQSFGFNLLLALPIFDGGRHQAAVRKSRAELELVEAQSRQSALRAFREVEDQLSAIRLLAEEEQAARAGVAADSAARAIAERRFTGGAISRLELIDIDRHGLVNARRLGMVRNARYLATVNLVRALGGGWSGTTQSAAPALASKD